MPTYTDTVLRRAKAAHVAQNLVEAERLYEATLVADPRNRDARLMLGILFAQSEREAPAYEILSELVKQDPKNFNALSWLSGILSTLERFPEAAEMAGRALELKPDHYQTLLHYATACFGLDQFENAANTFLRLIRMDPKNLASYYGLATTFLRLGDPHQARLVLNDAAHVSADPETLLKLGEVCLSCERADETFAVTERILQRDPRNLKALLLKIRALRFLQDEEAEDRTITLALKLGPENALAHTLKGRRLQTLGKFEGAEEEFRISIELNPNQGFAYHGVTSGRKIVQEDAGLLASMQSALAHKGLSDDEATHLHYALGKAYENLADYRAAMAHFDEGNRLMRRLRMGTRPFDRDAMTRQFKQISRIFSKEMLAKEIDPEPQSLQPIIVAGTMRSGTTLLEQILSRHPLIGPGGEQSFWGRIDSECVDYESETINTKRLRQVPSEYCDLLSSVAPGFPFVTDKNPANRTAYGLIHLAFPGTRILNMQRDPVDVAISMYTTLVRTAASYVGDKEGITFALKMHKKLMSHWIDVLPETTLKVIRYEQLVQGQEPVTRDAISFLGLEWDSACLSPEANTRTVVTPSLWQVRQPVNSNSVERWRRYEPWLGPFAELIE